MTISPEQQWEMLEAAAKACGIELTYENGSPQRVVMFRGNLANYEDWNPLTNALDTAEMCAEIGIDWINIVDSVISVSAEYDFEAFLKDHDNSRLKAWMYAATMVAAKIGGYTE